MVINITKKLMMYCMVTNNIIKKKEQQQKRITVRLDYFMPYLFIITIP